MDVKPPHRPALTIGAGDNALPRSRSVLLLVDFINPLQFPGADSIAPAALRAAHCTARLKQVLAQRGVPAVYANDNYGTWRSQFSDVLDYCQGLPGEAGEIARLLAPAEGDLTILKPRHSGFYATPLELLLTQMHAHELIVVGLSADMCVQLTAMDAYLRGYSVWAPADCTASETPELKQAALDYIARVFKAETCDSTAAAHRLPQP
ncbi:cysteine hydrolase family protein [Azohydromonas caseinilytica]|uniref:Cysteine hydrolase n=1 Tax=Azohydromonas caseinilytica TaxID=2728836 RepID=A0A848F1J6_9BURK|nr:isochorismatase family cysteine hydrolase [Azohydromonas caseinilytica]NML13554.1 cysteine hydrolase [Azohydromonas caseinilytica]